MKRAILTVLAALIPFVGHAAFPTNTSSKTVNIDKEGRDFSDFNFRFKGYEDQNVQFVIKDDNGGVDLTGNQALFKANRQVSGGSNVVYIAIQSGDITINTSNVTFSIAHTNIPPDNTYKAELLLYTGTTNVTRTLAQGMIRVEESLFREDDGTWQNPQFTNLTDYLLITTAAATYETKATNSPTANFVLATDGTNNYWSSAGVGDITAVNVSGGLLSGGGTSGDVTVTLTTNAVSNAVAGSGFLTTNITTAVNMTNINNLSYIDFNTNYVNGTAEGRLQWSDNDETLEVGLGGGTVTLQIGQEQVVRGKNTTGGVITNGKAIAIIGASGNRPAFALADADASGITNIVSGLATEDISNNAEGYVATFGLVRGIDTTGYSAEGVALYLSTTAGELTETMPTPPTDATIVAIVVTKAVNGTLLVNPKGSKEYSDLDDRYLQLDGSVAMTGALDMGDNVITNSKDIFITPTGLYGEIHLDSDLTILRLLGGPLASGEAPPIMGLVATNFAGGGGGSGIQPSLAQGSWHVFTGGDENTRGLLDLTDDIFRIQGVSTVNFSGAELINVNGIGFTNVTSTLDMNTNSIENVLDLEVLGDVTVTSNLTVSGTITGSHAGNGFNLTNLNWGLSDAVGVDASLNSTVVTDAETIVFNTPAGPMDKNIRNAADTEYVWIQGGNNAVAGLFMYGLTHANAGLYDFRTTGRFDITGNSGIRLTGSADTDAAYMAANGDWNYRTNSIAGVDDLEVLGSVSGNLVPSNRTITAGSGLDGGGALDTNITIQVDYSTLDARYVTSATNRFQAVYVGDTTQLGSELVVNGGCTNPLTDWTLGGSAQAGTGANTNSIRIVAGTQGTISQDVGFEHGLTYLVEYFIKNTSGEACTNIVTVGNGSYTFINFASATNSIMLPDEDAADSSITITVNATNMSADVHIDNISAKRVTAGNLSVANDLHVGGDLVVQGVVGSASFAQLFMDSPGLGYSVAGTYVHITNYSEYTSQGITATPSNFVTTSSGTYDVYLSTSFTSSGIETWELAVHTNGLEANHIECQRYTSSSDVGNTSMGGILDLNIGDTVDLRVKTGGATRTFTPTKAQFVLERRD